MLISKRSARAQVQAALALAVLAWQSKSADAVTYTAADTFALGPANFNSQAEGISGTQQTGYGYNAISGGFNHALLWNSTASNYLDLNPTGFASSEAFGISNGQEVGYASTDGTIPKAHAVLWNSSSTSYTDINPTSPFVGVTSSQAVAISGGQQVGYGYGGGTGGTNQYNALLWYGTAASAVDLNPSGFAQSWAFGTNGSQQVGYARVSNSTLVYDAILWSGTAGSAVNLNPAGFNYTEATGTAGNQQVGFGDQPSFSNYHALLWTGTAASAVDLNPSGYSYSAANATNGVEQVGAGFLGTTPHNHALVWFGSAASFVDISGLIPAGYEYPEALSVDPYGNVSGDAYFPNGSLRQGIEWLAGDMYNPNANGTSWSASSTWLSGTPASGNDVLLIASDGQARTIIFDSASSPSLGNLTIDANSGGSMTLSQAQGTLSVANESVGFVGSGAFNQSGGAHSVTGVLTLGENSGSTGSYRITAGTLTAGFLQINIGVFTLAGGSVTLGNLSISPAGTFDVTNNHLIINYGANPDPIS